MTPVRDEGAQGAVEAVEEIDVRVDPNFKKGGDRENHGGVGGERLNIGE